MRFDLYVPKKYEEMFKRFKAENGPKCSSIIMEKLFGEAI